MKRIGNLTNIESAERNTFEDDSQREKISEKGKKKLEHLPSDYELKNKDKGDETSNNRKISGIHKMDGNWKVDTPKTIEYYDNHLKGDRHKNFKEALASGSDHKARLVGSGKEFWRTGNIGGNYLSNEHPGNTVKERQENLQLPPENNAQKLNKVKLSKPQVVLQSDIKEQPEFAQQANYKARPGIKQTYLLDKNNSKEMGIDSRYSPIQESKNEKLNG